MTEVPGWRDRLSTRGLVFTAVCAIVGVVCLASVPATRHDNLAMRSAALCPGPRTTPQGSPDCLAQVPGRITDLRVSHGRYSRSVRWLFTPADPAAGFPARWVTFRHDTDREDWSPAMAHLFAGRPVTGRYWGDEPVVFATPRGTVETTEFRRNVWTWPGWAGVAALGLAACYPVAAWGRRRTTDGRPGRLGVVVVGLSPVAVFFGAVAAIFPTGLGAQVLAAGCAATGFLALGAAAWAWGRWRTARASRA